MNTKLSPFKTVFLILLLGWLAASNSYAQINLGAIGDSMTDEYLPPSPSDNQYHTDLAAYSWLEILDQTRYGDINVGSYLAPPKPLPASGGWPDNREYGFEYNWAKTGGAASRTSVITTNFGETTLNLAIDSLGSAYGDTQAAGLESLIIQGLVDTAYVGLGSNDFFYQSRRFNFNGADFPRDPPFDPNDPIWQAISAADVAGAILDHVETLTTTGVPVDIILALIPLGTASSEQEPGVLSAINQANAILLSEAPTLGVPADAIVDLWGFIDDPGRLDALGNIQVGELLVLANTEATDPADLAPDGVGPCNSSGDCATLLHSTKYIADDGLHPNTIVQALMANEVLKAMNSAYGAGITLLSDEEILELVSIPIDDMDSDGLTNSEEASMGTDPLNRDTDGDGKEDNIDNCPLAINAAQSDADGDGIGNACDPDWVPPPGC